MHAIRLTRLLNGAIGLANRHLFSWVDMAMAPRASLPLAHPPVFIIGPPRCGSTLLMQLIASTLDVGYLSNRHCQWSGSPAVAEYLYRASRHALQNATYESAHGRTEGWHGPAECPGWWYRFFRRHPSYVSVLDADPQAMKCFRRSLAFLAAVGRKTFVFKNLYASVRICPITKWVPESLFIVVYRDEIANACSLLQARHDRFGSYEPWFSLEPPGVESLKDAPPAEQVVEQIRRIYSVIDRDLSASAVPATRRLNLQYEEVCRSPSETIGRIREFLSQNGEQVAEKAQPPLQFSSRSAAPDHQTLYYAVCEYSGRKSVVS